MAAELIEVEAWVLVDADGNWVVAANTDDLHTRYTEDVGDDTQTPRRTFCVKIRVPKPRVCELTAEVGEEAEPAGLKVA
jgi:hypothetical protein